MQTKTANQRQRERDPQVCRVQNVTLSLVAFTGRKPPFRVSGSVGGDCENRVLGLGRGSGFLVKKATGFGQTEQMSSVRRWGRLLWHLLGDSGFHVFVRRDFHARRVSGAWVRRQCGVLYVLWVLRLSGPAGRVCSARWFTECERDGGEGRVLNASVVWVAFRLPLFGVDVCMRSVCRARGGAADVRSGKAMLEAVAIRTAFGSPRFCVSQARECARGLSRCSGTVEFLGFTCVVELQLDFSSVIARLRGCSCVVLSGLDTGVMNQ
ncbi:hypothetical protein Taro_006468 [Colocasia esculenta]|uniref:Uncharacterized protein n=1 Tax=Colocasia esculenta TaxID=4460 RepID=A0A843TST5_COLES|nr:hypothetical protein [Colocasia esculenta]